MLILTEYHVLCNQMCEEGERGTDLPRITNKQTTSPGDPTKLLRSLSDKCPGEGCLCKEKLQSVELGSNDYC